MRRTVARTLSFPTSFASVLAGRVLHVLRWGDRDEGAAHGLVCVDVAVREVPSGSLGGEGGGAVASTDQPVLMPSWRTHTGCSGAGRVGAARGCGMALELGIPNASVSAPTTKRRRTIAPLFKRGRRPRTGKRDNAASSSEKPVGQSPERFIGTAS